jgi:hypothetical protein
MTTWDMQFRALPGIPLIEPGDDLPALIAKAAQADGFTSVRARRVRAGCRCGRARRPAPADSRGRGRVGPAGRPRRVYRGAPAAFPRRGEGVATGVTMAFILITMI